jgi:hypothetical protein
MIEVWCQPEKRLLTLTGKVWIGKQIAFCNCMLQDAHSFSKEILKVQKRGTLLAVFVNKINNLATQSWKKNSGICFIEKKNLA